jgi:hypothetical protein
MSFVDGVTYKKEQEFTQEQLTALTPGSIDRWMKLWAAWPRPRHKKPNSLSLYFSGVLEESLIKLHA